MEVGKFEVHYYLYDDKLHSMDAFDKNKSEFHFLKIVKEVSDLLRLDINVESEAIREGGIKEIMRFLSRTKPWMLNLFLNILAGLMVYYATNDPEIKSLQKEELELAIEEHKLQIRKLQEEFKQDSCTNESEIAENAVKVLSSDSSIKRQKSNYYKVIQNNHTISKVSFTEVNESNLPIAEPREVTRSDFQKFISKTDNLPTIIDDDAVIEIISPVLKQRDYSWRGIYNGEVIYFKLHDKIFKNDVVNKKVSFSNGSSIKCALQIKRKYDENDRQECSYIVTTVLEHCINEINTETDQGKQYKRQKDAEKLQGTLF